jgi:outer membrane protein TolC
LGPRLQATQAAFDAAAQAHQISINRYKGALDTYLDVLSAEDTLISAQRQLADIKARRLSLDIALVRALGGGYASDAAVDAQGSTTSLSATSISSQHS